MNNTRRRVLRWITFGLGSLITLLPQRMRGAFAQDATETFEKIGTVADLEKAGFLAGKLAAGTPIVVFKDPTDTEALVALDATCTHAGCASEWNAKDALLVCPCHGSRFKADGTVARGPARTALTTLTVKVDGTDVVVASA
ncbi:MAG: cytochrome b6-f complex iron-sulfur subunit [Synechococcales cyanobacterium]